MLVLMQKVALVLESLGLPCKWELECTRTEYVIDIAFPDVKLAIEVDGPLHFMRNAPKPTGRTAGVHSLTFAAFQPLPGLPFDWNAAAAFHALRQCQLCRVQGTKAAGMSCSVLSPLVLLGPYQDVDCHFYILLFLLSAHIWSGQCSVPPSATRHDPKAATHLHYVCMQSMVSWLLTAHLPSPIAYLHPCNDLADTKRVWLLQ